MDIATSLLRRALVAGLALCLFAVGGCGLGDVQFQGKIFDAVGLNNSHKNRSTPKLAERAPLVVPPSTQQLPQPGSGSANEPVGALATINDPDAAKKKSKEQLEAEQAAYCRKHYDPAVFRGDHNAVDIEGPLGPCRKTIWGAVKKVTGGE